MHYPQKGFLIETEVQWAPHDKARRKASSFLREQPFARALLAALQDPEALDPTYRDALAAYAHWRSPSAPAAQRYAALTLACRLLLDLCNRAASFPRLSTLGRVTADEGMRTVSAGCLLHLTDQARRGSFSVAEPFWPACPRYDAIDPGNRIADFLVAAAVEQLERSVAFSSIFLQPGRHLSWLCSTPFASAEMERRRVLNAMRAGQTPGIPERLRAAAADNLNPDIWRNGFSRG